MQHRRTDLRSSDMFDRRLAEVTKADVAIWSGYVIPDASFIYSTHQRI